MPRDASSIAVIVVALCASSFAVLAAEPHNTLSAKERAEGWQLLFDGRTMNHWIDPAGEIPPGDAWSIDDGCLKAKPHPRITEDLVSQRKYRDFELQWDWKIAPGGNSGMKYRIQRFVVLSKQTVPAGAKRFEDKVDYAINHSTEADRSKIGSSERAQVYVVGFEYQMIDNARHPDARRGLLYQTGALYSIMGPSQAASKPAGEFNHSLLIVKGEHVEHWLNGVKVVDTTLNTEQMKKDLATRWGANSEVYRLLVDQPVKDCPISLQNHDNDAWFRDIKIKPLP
ncbi:MAG TPA: DUF1080 domain-containing protein [Bryobacteraceae bacterium]|jgi:hypothetical protein|nr:DUF1080 domain-containing protein [Bryobacteraceae bacterium]